MFSAKGIREEKEIHVKFLKNVQPNDRILSARPGMRRRKVSENQNNCGSNKEINTINSDSSPERDEDAMATKTLN